MLEVASPGPLVVPDALAELPHSRSPPPSALV